MRPRSPGSGVPVHRRYWCRLRPRFRAGGLRRTAAAPVGFPWQRGRRVLRLYALSGCLPHHSQRAGVRDQAARAGRRPGKGLVHHCGPRARHQRGPQAIRHCLQSQVRGAARHAGADCAGGEGIQGPDPEECRHGPEQLHRRPFGRSVCVRPERPAASVRGVRPGCPGLRTRHRIAAEIFWRRGAPQTKSPPAGGVRVQHNGSAMRRAPASCRAFSSWPDLRSGGCARPKRRTRRPARAALRCCPRAASGPR